MTVGAATMAAGFAVLEFNREAFAESVGVRPMLAGLLPMLGTRGNIPVLRVSVIAVIALALMLVAALTARRGAALALLGVVTIAMCGIRTHEALNTRLNSWEPTTQVQEIDELIPPDATLGVKFVHDADYPKVEWDDQRRRIQLYQFSLPDHLVLHDYGVDDSVGPYVFAPMEDSELTAAGAKVIWKDPKIQYALWQEPSPPRPIESRSVSTVSEDIDAFVVARRATASSGSSPPATVAGPGTPTPAMRVHPPGCWRGHPSGCSPTSNSCGSPSISSDRFLTRASGSRPRSAVQAARSAPRRWHSSMPTASPS